MNFMLLVPLASYPAVEIRFDASAAGISRSASERAKSECYASRRWPNGPSGPSLRAFPRSGQADARRARRVPAALGLSATHLGSEV
jgi:hypothetical protein